MQALDRLLALVCRELSASRAWVEYASAPPPDVLSAPVRDGWRLCAAVAEPPADAQRQLEELAASFDRVLLEATEAAPIPAAEAEAASTLRHMLDVLVERVGASMAWVIDEQSPMVWGSSSEGRWLGDVGQARRIGDALGDHLPEQVMRWADGQQLPPPPSDLAPHLDTVVTACESVPASRLIVTWAAVAQASNQRTAWSWDREPLHVIVRPFAAIYRLLVLFEAPFSPLHAETTLTKALPVLERLVTDHPPVDPAPQGARVHAFIRPDR